MKIDDIIKDLPNNKKIIVLTNARTDFLTWNVKVIANCPKWELANKMNNYNQATVTHFYENKAFDALIIKVTNYWLQKIQEERNYGKSILSGEKRPRKIYRESGTSQSGTSYVLPTVYYVEEE